MNISVSGVISETARLASCSGNHIHSVGPVVIARERDLRAVWRERRFLLVTSPRQAPNVNAIAVRRPDSAQLAHRDLEPAPPMTHHAHRCLLMRAADSRHN